jgi:Xaa-Pro aminopeptidase
MDTLDSPHNGARPHCQPAPGDGGNGLAAVVIPSSDPHLSEYLPERWKGREWASGFTGSVGTLIVTREHAGGWVDSRYWTQAEVQLAGTGIDLMKVPGAVSLAHADWLAETNCARRYGGGRRRCAGAAAGRALESALTREGYPAAHRSRPASRVWTDRAAADPAIYEHVAPHATMPAATNLHWCARKCARPAPRITSFRRSTISRG